MSTPQNLKGHLNTRGRPILDKGDRRSKLLSAAITPEQLEQFTILSRMMGETKACRFLYRLIVKVVEDNKEAIEQYREVINRFQNKIQL